MRSENRKPKSALALRLRSAQAFTLIELMVVVTIIVVLMSMLLPAMEGAIYQANLATCGANFKTVASAATLYANDNQSHYPQRHPDYSGDALWLRMVASAGYGFTFDFRPKWTPYMTIESFVDPLLPELDLSDAANGTDVNLYSSFNIYTSLPRGDLKNDAAMDRVGQKWEFTDTKSASGPREGRYGVLAGDRDMYWQPGSIGANFSASSHPDGLQPRLMRAQYYKESWGTLAQWGQSPHKSRPVDMNYAYSDGSVQRYNNVVMEDERMSKVSAFNLDQYNDGGGAANAGRWEHVPRE